MSIDYDMKYNNDIFDIVMIPTKLKEEKKRNDNSI